MKLFSAFFRYFTHESIASDSLDFTRNLMRLSSVSITVCASFIYMFAAYYFNYAIGVYVCFFLICYHVFLLYAIKHKKFSDETLAHFSGIFSSIAINIAVCTTGGPSSPVVFWMLASIVYAFWMSAIRTGLFWTVLFAVQYFVMIYLEMTGTHFPNLLSESYVHPFNYLIFTGIFGYLAMMLMFFDIWRKAVIKELNSLNYTKDRMISMIGHDLKNPLSILMGQAKIMDQTKSFDQSYHESSKYLLSRMKRIIENMVVFERIETDKLETNFEEFDLDQIIQALLLEYSYHSTSHDITLNYVKKSEIHFNHIDKLNLERILSNLISNSLKYSPKKTTVTITTDIVDNKAVISVKDQGIGIEGDHLKKLFQIYAKGPYAPLMRKEDSNGIGLYIVKELCRKIGAKIDVYSEGKDRGTEFTLSIPLS